MTTQPYHCKIYRFLPRPNDWDRSRPPLEVDYEIGLVASLYNVTTQDAYGRVTRREFYGAFEIETGIASDLICTEDWVWTLDNVGQPTRTEVTTSYVLEDESIAAVIKYRVTYYINEGNTLPERRERTALVEQTKAQLMSLSDEFGQTPQQARSKLTDFCQTFRSEIWLWEQIYSNDLWQAIEADATIGWLDIEYPVGSGTTIRERLVARFTPPPGTVNP